MTDVPDPRFEDVSGSITKDFDGNFLVTVELKIGEIICISNVRIEEDYLDFYFKDIMEEIVESLSISLENAGYSDPRKKVERRWRTNRSSNRLDLRGNLPNSQMINSS